MAERSPRGPSTFRQRDLKAFMKAARQAGIDRFRVEFEHGKITVTVGEDQHTVPASREAGGSEWDDAEAL